jgi:hypothetical protein
LFDFSFARFVVILRELWIIWHCFSRDALLLNDRSTMRMTHLLSVSLFNAHFFYSLILYVLHWSICR